MSVLKGNKYFYDYEVSDVLAANLRDWLSYGLLETGAYTNVSFNNSGTSGYTTLQRVHDDRYRDGQIYEGLGPSWVWEKDVGTVTSIPLPIVASGIHIGGNFYPTSSTSGIYQHNIDFKHGRVIFNNPVNSGQVQCEYTFRDIDVYAVDSPSWKTMVEEYTKYYNGIGQNSPSGMASILKQNRVWLPSVIVEVENRTNTPLQLGGGELAEVQVAFHIFTDKPFSNRRLIDLLGNQYDKVLSLYDVNNTQFPYNWDGTLISGALTYPVLANRANPYFWTFGRISDTDGGTRNTTTDIFRGEVSYNMEVERYLRTY